MRDLLRNNERRHLEMLELLFDKNDWITVSELSKQLDSSVRIINYDLNKFRTSADDFVIETSHKGIRLVLNNDKSLKSIYKHILKESVSFNLLEFLLINETMSVTNLAEHLYISESSLYRQIGHINKATQKYDFKIATNPCRVIGNEKSIRNFYTHYMYERYTRIEWPYEHQKIINNVELDLLLKTLIKLTNFPVDFALYGLFKLVSFVNFVRLKNKHYLNSTDINSNFLDIIPQYKGYDTTIKKINKNYNRLLNINFINQTFAPFVNRGFSLSYGTLQNKIATDEKLAKEFKFLDQLIDELAAENDLELENKEEILLDVLNAAYLRSYDPRYGYILYNRNYYFNAIIEEHFNDFYKQLHGGIKNFLAVSNMPTTQIDINYLIYILFSRWKHIIPSLRKKHQKIKILVISNRHYSHSSMIKEFIEYEFSKQLIIDTYIDLYLSKDILEELDYDIIIANFDLPKLSSKNCLNIENIPTFKDIKKIQNEIEHVIERRQKPQAD